MGFRPVYAAFVVDVMKPDEAEWSFVPLLDTLPGRLTGNDQRLIGLEKPDIECAALDASSVYCFEARFSVLHRVLASIGQILAPQLEVDGDRLARGNPAVLAVSRRVGVSFAFGEWVRAASDLAGRLGNTAERTPVRADSPTNRSSAASGVDTTDSVPCHVVIADRVAASDKPADPKGIAGHAWLAQPFASRAVRPFAAMAGRERRRHG